MLLEENARRNAIINAKFNPVTGEGSLGKRVRLEVSDMPVPWWIPVEMANVPLVKKLTQFGSIERFLEELGGEYDDREKVLKQLIRVRCRYDFPFWAVMFVFIKPKGEGGEDIRFRLNRPQRKLIARLERMRKADKPIRLILLKARQWGGSTATQIYMAWLQLIHRKGLNSLIVGHQNTSSTEVKDMFDRMLDAYPVEMLYNIGEDYDENEPKLIGVGKTGNIQRCPQRNFKIKLGSAERVNSARGGDYNLVHCTEVGLWKETDGKTPEEIVKSACSGVQRKPYTMIVYESTANGTGNFFHREYLAAKDPDIPSPFEALFIPWYEIEWNTIPFASREEEERFAQWLYDNRENEEVRTNREESGKYLWHLWEIGATLEAINWYIVERSSHDDHAHMASECPTDDVEAFTFSGRRVFAADDIAQLKPSCRPPKYVGEIYGRDEQGEEALEDVIFKKEPSGRFWMWQDVEKDGEEDITDRYLVVVDVCKGHTKRADYSVILVLDRIYMMDNGYPAVVAQWYGRIDMDLLAWKAAQTAHYYNDALLVIESNTLETNNTKGEAEYILNLVREVYDNLYARKQSAEDIREGVPRKYGFHTNVSTKKTIIHNLKTFIRQHLYTERDERCLDEYNTYIENDKGAFEAMEGHHDDLLMTRAIGLYISLKEMPIPAVVRKPQVKITNKSAVSAATI